MDTYTAGMDESYLNILRSWQASTGLPSVYNALDILLPEYAFRRFSEGTLRDHWASPYKLDLSEPKVKSLKKTVIYSSEYLFREQGEWRNPVGMIDLIMRHYGIASVYECWKFLSGKLSLAMPEPDSEQTRRAVQAKNRHEALLSFLQGLFTESLWKKDDRRAGETRKYLRSRGFNNETSLRIGFGFVPKWSFIARAAADAGFNLDETRDALGVQPQMERLPLGYRHVLSIPYVCADTLKGFLFRRIDGDESPKYIASKNLDRASVFFGIGKYASRRIVAVEGEMDALMLASCGIAGVVSIGGSSIAGNRRRQVEDALNRGVKEIVLFPDLDADKNTGEVLLEKRHTAILQSIHTIKDVNLFFEGIKVVRLQECGDPDEFARGGGAAAIRKMIDEAVPYWDYLAEYNTAGKK